MRGGLDKVFTFLLQRKLNPLFFRTADHLTMIVDRALVLIVSLVLSFMIILYIILVMKFVLRKARQKAKNEYDEPATISFLDHFTMWHPRKFASTKCIPVQPRTYEELQRVLNFVYWEISRQHFFNFSWVLQFSQERLKTMIMQYFRGKEGALWEKCKFGHQ